MSPALLALFGRERTPTSAIVVSMWRIPGGYDYANAEVVTGFFEEEEREEAVALVERYKDIPEMADMTTIEIWDNIQRKNAAHQKKVLDSHTE